MLCERANAKRRGQTFSTPRPLSTFEPRSQPRIPRPRKNQLKPMAQTNADRLLNRITALHKSLHLDDGGHISKMERDLMLTYLREFYEIYAEGSEAPAGPSIKQITTSTPPPPPRRPVAEGPWNEPRSSGAPASIKAPPKVSVSPEPPEIGQSAPTVEPIVEQVTHRYEPDAQVTPPRPMPEPPSAPVPPPPPPAVGARTAVVASSPADPAAGEGRPSKPRVAPTPARPPQPKPAPADPAEEQAIDALFEEQGATGRFGRQPLNDLTRALSINNRILFTRDLFGGDNELLNTTLQQLNNSGSMREARPLLHSLVRRFDWLGEARQDSAREFIELVRRKYV